jgi:hypothetical protein
MQDLAGPATRLRIGGAWRWLRLASLPIVLVVALWQREWIFSQLEAAYGLGFAELPIKLYSTMMERLLVAGGYAGVLVAIVLGVYFLAPQAWRYASGVLLMASASVALAVVLGLPFWMGLAPALILALNAVPEAALGRLLHHRVGGKVAAVALGGGIAIAETVLPRPFWMWVAGDRAARPDDSGGAIAALLSWAPGVVIAAVVFGLGAPYSKLVKLGWLLNASDEVQLVYGGEHVSLYSPFDVAAIPFDPKGRRIYLCGNGIPEALVLPADAPMRSPENTHMAAAGVEFCILDPVDRSFIAYDSEEDALKVWDLDSWQIRNRIPLGLPPESHAVFLSKQDGSPTVVAASEIDGDTPSMRAIDVVTGATLGASQVIAGHMIVDPTGPRVFVDFYTRETGVLQLDLPSLKVVARSPSDQRNDRMAVDAKRGHLLVASPLHGRVLVYAVDGLAQMPSIPSTLGVRSVEVDNSRDLLLTASLVSNYVDVIDLTANRLVKRLRVGPWLRNLALDEACGRAFVASRHGLYWVKYAEPLPACPGATA